MRKKKIDEGTGKGEWKKVRRIYDELTKMDKAREMEELLKKARDITRELTGLDRIYAEIYLKEMERSVARWRVVERAMLS
jgi:hypothetical protein